MDKLTVFTATRIHTMDPGRPQADAVAVSNGRIVSVGTLESMQPWLRRTPYEIDDRFLGRIILPGFIDPHTHLRLSGTYMSLNYVGPIDSTDHLGQPLSGLPNQESVISRLKELVTDANNSSDGTTKSTLVAWGYDPGMQGGHLNRDILDAISTEIPIWVVAYAPHII